MNFEYVGHKLYPEKALSSFYSSVRSSITVTFSVILCKLISFRNTSQSFASDLQRSDFNQICVWKCNKFLFQTLFWVEKIVSWVKKMSNWKTFIPFLCFPNLDTSTVSSCPWDRAFALKSFIPSIYVECRKRTLQSWNTSRAVLLCADLQQIHRWTRKCIEDGILHDSRDEQRRVSSQLGVLKRLRRQIKCSI